MIARRFLPGGIRGQFLSLLLFVLVVVQCLSIWLFLAERRNAIIASVAKDGASRLLNVSAELDSATENDYQKIIRIAESHEFRLSINEEASASKSRNANLMFPADNLGKILVIPPERSLRIALQAPEHPFPSRPELGGHYDKDPLELVASVELRNGRWLNARIDIGEEPFQWAWQAIASILLTVAGVVIVVFMLVNRITGPLTKLALATERLGRENAGVQIAKSGPDEVIQLTRAFEDMADRITELLRQRSSTLAAIGHDLHSPLTAMRLRVEMVDDDETRERLELCLDEIQALVQAALALANGGDTREEVREFNLSLLLLQLVTDLREAGENASFTGETDVWVHGRPAAIKRAIRNIAENAARYGTTARMSLKTEMGRVHVIIEDDGPGIAEADRERVFEPFVRLEASRSRDTGGSGLGLALARMAIEANSGSIRLSTADCGGLRVAIDLPTSISP